MSETERAFAFAALAQAAKAVDDTAYGRQVDGRAVAPLVRAIFQIDAATVSDIYGGFSGLKTGIDTARAILGRANVELVPAMGYVVTIIDLARRLGRRRDIGARLQSELASLAARREGMTEDTLYAQLSKIYQSTISTLEQRIQVRGLPELLKREEVAAKIRALLLAAVRSAWLWQQLGGRRWHLVLARSNMRAALASAESHLLRH